MFVKEQKSGAWNEKTVIVRCEGCGEEREIKWTTARTKEEHLCRSCCNSGERHPNWGKHLSKETVSKIRKGNLKKGWRMQGSGYKAILVDEHPRAKPYKGGRYIMEHILVMEKKLGRFLKEHEIVHHIDGNKQNNDESNLYLCSGENKKESNQLHNACHQSAERLVFELFRKGLVVFVHGEYMLRSDFPPGFCKGEIMTDEKPENVKTLREMEEEVKAAKVL